MKYIEKNEKVTKEYEVLFNEEELVNIISELNNKCCRRVKKIEKVGCNSEKEALARFSSNGIHDVHVIGKTMQNNGNNPCKYIYEVMFYYEQLPSLSYILNSILRAYRVIDKEIDVTEAINQLIAYKNSDELKPYQARMGETGISEELYLEYENNKDFDFELLSELYQKSLSCFQAELVSKTIHYTDNRVVKKLGGR